MSFLQRLKNRGVQTGQSSVQSDTKEIAVAQLDVDVYQTDNSIVVYAQAAGADMSDVNVSIEGEADIIIIEGRRIRPENFVFPERLPEGAYFASECVWGDFYRRIILPESVVIEKAEAKIKNGVLILILPLLKSSEKERIRLRAEQEQKLAKVITE